MANSGWLSKNASGALLAGGLLSVLGLASLVSLATASCINGTTPVCPAVEAGVVVDGGCGATVFTGDASVEAYVAAQKGDVAKPDTGGFIDAGVDSGLADTGVDSGIDTGVDASEASAPGADAAKDSAVKG